MNEYNHKSESTLDAVGITKEQFLEQDKEFDNARENLTLKQDNSTSGNIEFYLNYLGLEHSDINKAKMMVLTRHAMSKGVMKIKAHFMEDDD